MSRSIGVIIPTRWEACDILRRFPFQKKSSGLYRAEIEGRAVLLSISGVGADAAKKAAAALVKAGAGELVSMGFCGALQPDQQVGDLVTDRVASQRYPARTPAERQAVTARANAVAVDMETKAIIEEGTRLGVPIHVRRVISDHFNDDLSPLFGPQEDFSAFRIACRLLHPRAWSLALKLRRQSRTAAVKLADALDRYPDA